MEAVAEYAVQVLVLLIILGFGIFMRFTRAGTEAQFFVLFALVGFALPTALGSGITLAVVDFLYPQAVVVGGFAGFLWLVVLASLASTVVFDLGAESLLLRLLRRFGMSLNSIKLVEAVVGGVFIAAALYATAFFLPGADISIAATFIAGEVSAFARYFIGLYLEDNVSGGNRGRRKNFSPGRSE